MDSTDQKIISELKNDGRASFTEIADKVDVSEGTVRNRVQSLQEEGVIEKFTVEVEDQGTVQAFVSVNVSTERSFSAIVDEFPESLEIFEIAGDMDLLIKISRNSSAEVNDVVDSMREVRGVENTKTYMVLKEKS